MIANVLFLCGIAAFLVILLLAPKISQQQLNFLSFLVLLFFNFHFLLAGAVRKTN